MQQAFLRVPPFPGARGHPIARPGTSSPGDVEAIGAAMAEARVGGAFWGTQPPLPHAGYVLVGPETQCIEAVPELDRARCWQAPADADPWHIVSGASAVVVGADDELALVAALSGITVHPVGQGRFAALSAPGTLNDVLVTGFGRWTYADPFSGEVSTPLDLVRQLGAWRRLIDGNRRFAGSFGIAGWKRPTVAPLLWAGTATSPSSPSTPIPAGETAIVWTSRTGASTLARLKARNVETAEIEDGFIRSSGLGADCVPPLSIIVDRRGIYFDPRRSSDLEEMLERGDFSAELIDRAAALRRAIVERGISKYQQDSRPSARRNTDRTQILVPGQVEDDRAVLVGGCGLTANIDLLRRVRAQAPDAYVIYKPHPDVDAGHRRGGVPDDRILAFADEIVRDEPIAALIAMADEVHVNTSLAGFEALLRGKPVTTYGVPFYAGWGLSTDLGPIPARRTARRSLDELVAATLILYPRYVDPVTLLPCEVELLVERLAEGADDGSSGFLVALRRLQGRIRRRLGTLVG